MTRPTAEARFDVALRTRAMIALVERFLAGHASREELRIWAHAQGDLYSDPPPFHGNGAADDLHTCLWNIEAHLRSGEFLVRDRDLTHHLRGVREGRPTFAHAPVAEVRLSLDEIARRTQVPATRFPIEGLGWFAQVAFASASTNHHFSAFARLEPYDPSAPLFTTILTSVFPSSPSEAAHLLDDLRDTLVIDRDDLLLGRAMLTPTPPTRYDLVRIDDNGHRFVVASYSGYAKARKHLAEYEALSHKQTYWLEARETNGET